MADIIDIDSILENDLMDALGDIENLPTVDVSVPEIVVEDEPIIETQTSTDQTMNIDNTNIDNIAQLIKDLLKDKTIEITIKVKGN